VGDKDAENIGTGYLHVGVLVRQVWSTPEQQKKKRACGVGFVSQDVGSEFPYITRVRTTPHTTRTENTENERRIKPRFQHATRARGRVLWWCTAAGLFTRRVSVACTRGSQEHVHADASNDAVLLPPRYESLCSLNNDRTRVMPTAGPPRNNVLRTGASTRTHPEQHEEPQGKPCQTDTQAPQWKLSAAQPTSHKGATTIPLPSKNPHTNSPVVPSRVC